ncbi:hypothetical protein BSL78_16395 [Apostichopus japonicus]|uniref:Atos-like conserved domain-containing protein n=1 Tax=Stichopus japonicus TaxID=307972 RepID=A0A2G8KFF3_STIJA|nr:hypothetical protein BSL78_16395 [Apostichopus japonicus]
MGAEGSAAACGNLSAPDMDPADLFVDLGMLVLESRKPHPSAKGRIESPHCPVSSCRKNYHVCTREDPQCQEKEAVKSYIQFLCRNAIPMSIEVMLFPECCYQNHNRVEIGATSEAGWHADQPGSVAEANYHLLEQWIVQLLPKRFPDGLAEPYLLLQAVRSFLCFSQISSWLSNTMGRSPETIVYRVCAPGEGFGANFEVEPEVHTFPVINITKTTSIKVSVAYPPRQDYIPTIPCSIDHSEISKLAIAQKGLLSRLEKRERDFCERRRGGRHTKPVDSQSSSSDEGSLEERAGAKSKKNPKFHRPKVPEHLKEEPNLEVFERSVNVSNYSEEMPTLNLRYELTPKQYYPFLNSSDTSPPPPLQSKKDQASLSLCPSSKSWEQSLADLEVKYSCLNLDDIPSTECSSFEQEQVNFDPQKEVFELHKVKQRSKFQDSRDWEEVEESRDEGIVFTAHHDSLENFGSHEFESDYWEQNADFSPMPLDHRIRTVSDSVTCSPNVRHQDDFVTPFTRNVQSLLSSEITCKPISSSRLFGEDLDSVDDEASFQNGRVPSSQRSSQLGETRENISRSQQVIGSSTKPGLLKNVLSKSARDVPNKGKDITKTSAIYTPKKPRKTSDYSGAYIFNPSTGLPINSSPALLRKAQTTADCTSLLPSLGPMKSSPSCNNLEQPMSTLSQATRVLSTSAPAATSCLLGNFEESVLNGRLEPLGTLGGFTAEIGASGSFCPKHVTYPVTVYFFSVADEDAPSSYYGHINLENLGKRGYRIPKAGTIQVILFNPNKTVVKMFVMRYDLSEMPPNCQTFARQRIFYMPSNADPDDDSEKQLRYLLHLRFQSSRSGRVYLHTDVRMIFARHCPDLESSLGTYELRSFTEFPTDPRFSPKK